MSELYTSLTRLKMALNGGTMPVMTPIPDKSLSIIDPAFTPGLGALEEDTEWGLRCPVRECGEFFHVLTLHLNTTHRDIGGADAIRKALDIPRSARFCSRTHSERKRELVMARTDDWRSHRTDAWRAQVGKRNRHYAWATTSMRNLRNRCEAQLIHALTDLRNQLGRSPTQREVEAMLPNGYATLQEIRRAWGTFNNCKAQIGLDTYGRTGTATLRKDRSRISREMVIDALSEWYSEHRALPSMKDVQNAARTPALPCRNVILRALGSDHWPEAMRRAAAILNIYGGRYGLEERLTA